MVVLKNKEIKMFTKHERIGDVLTKYFSQREQIEIYMFSSTDELKEAIGKNLGNYPYN